VNSYTYCRRKLEGRRPELASRLKLESEEAWPSTQEVLLPPEGPPFPPTETGAQGQGINIVLIINNLELFWKKISFIERRKLRKNTTLKV
jgi:hypothetical protein